MLLREIMTPEVITIEPEANIQEAAEIMQESNISVLPVMDGPGVMGMITDRDITVDAVARGLDPETTTVTKVMSHGVIFCYDDEDLPEAARTVQQSQVRRLLVLNRSKELVGIVAVADIALENRTESITVDILEEVSRPD